MPEYLLSVHMIDGEDPYATPEEMQEAFAATDALNAKMQEQGVWVFAGGLHTPDTATVVREQDGQIVTVDGPFSEAKEQVGGFWVINAPDRDAALDWARQATVACKGPVEVRPFQADPES